MTRSFVLAGLLCMANLSFAAFPDKPVRVVVPSPAGGPTDLAARVVGEQLSRKWGVPVLIENKPGASGAIATDWVVKSAPDGYTLLLHTPVMVATELTRPSAKYRSQRDLVAVTTLLTTPVVLVANNETSQGNARQVLAKAKESAAKGAPMSYGSSGEGTTTHYLGERLRTAANAELVHVPFAGESPLVQALVGGHVSMSFLSGGSARKAQETGHARLLGVASSRRSAVLPDIHTLAEQGLAGFERDSWVMLLAPAATKDERVRKLADDVNQVLGMPDVQAKLLAQGTEVRGHGMQEARKLLETEHKTWADLIRSYGNLAR